jgi:mRNA interferase MazF
MGMGVKRFDVYLANLDPTIGSEIRKIRPCLVISPDQMNDYLATVIIAPMTTKKRSYISRVLCRFQEKEGQVALDQIRTLDKTRLTQYLGRVDSKTQKQVLEVLSKMFAE